MESLDAHEWEPMLLPFTRKAQTPPVDGQARKDGQRHFLDVRGGVESGLEMRMISCCVRRAAQSLLRTATASANVMTAAARTPSRICRGRVTAVSFMSSDGCQFVVDHLIQQGRIDRLLQPGIHGLVTVEHFVADVTTTMGIIGQRLRNARQSEKPDRPGVRQSMTTRSGVMSASSALASVPLLARVTS